MGTNMTPDGIKFIPRSNTMELDEVSILYPPMDVFSASINRLYHRVSFLSSADDPTT